MTTTGTESVGAGPPPAPTGNSATATSDGAAAGSPEAIRPSGSDRLGVIRSPIRALGTYGELILHGRPAALGPALALLTAELAAIDLACSRFRPDSELMRVNARAGRRIAVSPLLAQAVAVAVRAAMQTAGDVTPLLGGALVAAGYDSDFRTLPPDGPAVGPHRPAVAWEEIEVDCVENTLRVPAGVALDLGATAKALAADRAATAIAAATGAGVLVNLGGDLAVAGPLPPTGWPVRITDRPVVGPAASVPVAASDVTPASLAGTGLRPAEAGTGLRPAAHDPYGVVVGRGGVAGPDGVADALAGEIVYLHGGGLATSSTAVRRWRRGDAAYHHILDPRTGTSAVPVWRCVTVTAATCVEANTASTASIVRGEAALDWLRELGLPAVLVSTAGAVHRVAGWPERSVPPVDPPVPPVERSVPPVGSPAPAI